MSKFSISNCLKKNKGAFLIEVLLSVMILAAGLTIIIQALLSSLRASTYVKDYSLALILTENKMHELLQEGLIRAPLREEKQFEVPFERFSYQLETEKKQGEKDFLNKVFLKCFWKAGHRTKEITLSTYLYNLPE